MCWPRSRRSPRWRCGTPRASRSASGRLASRAGSRGSPACSASPSRCRRRSRPSRSAATEAFAADVAAVLTPAPEGYRLAGAHNLPETLRGGVRRRAARRGGGARARGRRGRDDRLDRARPATSASASRFGTPPGPRRSSRSRSPFRASSGARLRSSSSASSESSPTTTSIWRASSPSARRRRSTAASSSRSSGASRLLAQQLADTGSLFSGELEPGAVLDEVVEQARVLLRADASLIRLLEGDELVVAAAAGGGEAEHRGLASAGRLQAGRDRRELAGTGRHPRGRAATRRCSPASRCSGAATPRTSPCRCSAPRASSRACSRCRPPAAVLAGGGDRGPRRARGERLGRLCEGRAVPAGRARAGAQRRHPRQRRRRHRRRRPGRVHRPLERGGRAHHRRACRGGARADAWRTCSSASSARKAARPRATGSCRSAVPTTRSGCR